MDQHGADIADALEAKVPPRRATVIRSVDPFADDDVAPESVRAGSHIHHIGVRIGRPDSADGPRGERAVRNVAPCQAAVLRLPHPAAARTHIKGRELIPVTGHRRHPPPAGGPYHAVLEAGEELRRNDGAFRRGLGSCGHTWHRHDQQR